MAYSLARRILTRRRIGRLAHCEMSDSPFHVTVWQVLSPVKGSQSSNDLPGMAVSVSAATPCPNLPMCSPDASASSKLISPPNRVQALIVSFPPSNVMGTVAKLPASRASRDTKPSVRHVAVDQCPPCVPDVRVTP